VGSSTSLEWPARDLKVTITGVVPERYDAGSVLFTDGVRKLSARFRTLTSPRSWEVKPGEQLCTGIHTMLMHDYQTSADLSGRLQEIDLSLTFDV
jgi:hypothetical protein